MTEQQSNKATGASLPPSFETAAAAIASRCYADRDFARRMRENPRAVIEEVCDRKLPESLAIEVHENDGQTWHLPVPHGNASDELSDEQLKSLSGGVEIIWTLLILGATAGAAAAATAGVGVGIAHGVVRS